MTAGITASITAGIATCFGVGLLRPASGTWGSLAALFCCALLEFFGCGKISLAFLAIISFAIGVSAAQSYGIMKKRADHSDIVIDEFSAQAGVLFFVPLSFNMGSSFLAGFWGYLAAFLLFRFFDIFKPFPAGWIDRRFKHGWGVMLDDFFAALWTILTLYFLELSLGRFLPSLDPIWGSDWHFFII